MRCKLSGLSIAALVGFALTSSPTFATVLPPSSDAQIHTMQHSLQKQKNFKRPIFLPPNPCKNRLCGRPRPR
jgi:hypothetical protein